MGIFTYARVSTLDQNTDMQVNALKAAYPYAVLREEKKSGSTVKDRFVLNIKGGTLEILDQKIDTATATGRAFLQMLGVFAEFETNLRKERQLAGIVAAKAKGKHLGRRSSLTDEQKKEIRTKNQTGMNPTTLSKEYGISRGTIYNVLKEAA